MLLHCRCKPKPLTFYLSVKPTIDCFYKGPKMEDGLHDYGQ